jgi:hypothetical protein
MCIVNKVNYRANACLVQGQSAIPIFEVIYVNVLNLHIIDLASK